MRKYLRRVLMMALPAVVVALMSVPLANAQGRFDNFGSFRRVEAVEPDTTAGEVTRSNEYLGDTLFRTTVRYQNGSVKIQEYLPGGVIKAEVLTDSGGASTVKLFTADGKGIARLTRIEKGRIEQTVYRSDGKTLWTRSVITQAGSGPSQRQVDYFDTSGRLRVHREFDASGEMNVTVYDGQGSLAYKQRWVSGVSGYVLVMVEEPLPGKQSRRLYVTGSKVDRCENLRSDGTVSSTEPGDRLSSPVDAMRLREYAPGDDPSIPEGIEPDRRIKR